MKILVINPILYTSEGSQVHRVATIKDTMIHAMCLGFRHLGHEVTLAAVDDYRPTADQQYDFEVLWFRDTLRWLLPSPLPCPWGLRSYLKHHAQEFDMILTSEVFAFTSLFAARFAPEKTLIWQELSVHQRKWHRWPSRFWHNCVAPWAFKHVPVVVPRSQRAHDFIKPYLKQTVDTVVDHGIDLSWLPVNSKKCKQFIAIGQLIERKGMDTIIDRFAQFCGLPQAEGYSLLIAGQGPMEDALRQQVARLGIDDRVKFLGHLSHAALGEYLAQSVASLVATSHDLNMVSVTESIAAGTPVIMNTVPNTADFVQQHALGIVRDKWDANDLLAVAHDQGFAQRCQAIRSTLSCEAAAQPVRALAHRTHGVYDRLPGHFPAFSGDHGSDGASGRDPHLTFSFHIFCLPFREK